MDSIRAVVAEVIRRDNPQEVSAVAHILPWTETIAMFITERARTCLHAAATGDETLLSALSKMLYNYNSSYVSRLYDKDIIEHLRALLPLHPELPALLLASARQNLYDSDELVKHQRTIFEALFQQANTEKLDEWWAQVGGTTHCLRAIYKRTHHDHYFANPTTFSGPLVSFMWLRKRLDEARLLEGDDRAKEFCIRLAEDIDTNLARARLLPDAIANFPFYVPIYYLANIVRTPKPLFRLFEQPRTTEKIFTAAVRTNNHTLIMRVVRLYNTVPSIPIPGCAGFVITDHVFNDLPDARDVSDELQPENCGFDTSPQAVESTRQLLYQLHHTGPSPRNLMTLAALPRQTLPKYRWFLLLRQRLLQQQHQHQHQQVQLPLLPTEIWTLIMENLYRSPLMTVAEHTALVKPQMLAKATRIRDLHNDVNELQYQLSLQHFMSDQLPTTEAERLENQRTKELVWKWREKRTELLALTKEFSLFNSITKTFFAYHHRLFTDIGNSLSRIPTPPPPPPEEEDEEDDEEEEMEV